MNEFVKSLPIIKDLVEIRRSYLRKAEKERNLRFDQKWESLFNSVGESVEHKFNNGIKIKLYKDSLLAKLIYRGDFEVNELNYLSQVLKSGDTFVDIGANIGLFSLYASKCVGASGRIISFEPSPKTFKRLQENISLNDINICQLHQLGLSDNEDVLKLNISGNGMDAWETFAPDTTHRFEKTVDVPVNTLDFILNNEDKSKIKLVKIDVEGWEKFVLFGGKFFFQEYSPIVMLEFTESNTTLAGYNVTELYDIMVGYGYKWYSIEDNELRPSPRKENYPYENLVARK